MKITKEYPMTKVTNFNKQTKEFVEETILGRVAEKELIKSAKERGLAFIEKEWIKVKGCMSLEDFHKHCTPVLDLEQDNSDSELE